MRKSPIAVLTALPLVALLAGAASAAPARVQASPATADPDYATVLKVSGSGFQSVPKGFGGIYLLFGWVSDGAWQPSKGGASGATYRYVPDKETKDNRGFQRFISFPGGDTASSANGGEITADGSWSTQLVVPGARFKATDRDGNVVDVDCLKTSCGLITVGAHGVANANNETFTPISFAVPGQKKAAPATTPPPPPSSSAPPSTSSAPPSPSASPIPSVVDTAPPTATVRDAAAESSGGTWWVYAVIAAVVVLAAVLTPLLLRRRRTRGADQEGK
jgi:hypothetical protein